MKVTWVAAIVSAVALFQGALSLSCTRSYDGSTVDRPDECQAWGPVCKSTGFCADCTGSYGSGETLSCTAAVPYCQTSNGRCKACTSDAECLAATEPFCVDGACVETVPTPAPTAAETPAPAPPPTFNATTPSPTSGTDSSHGWY